MTVPFFGSQFLKRGIRVDAGAEAGEDTGVHVETSEAGVGELNM